MKDPLDFLNGAVDEVGDLARRLPPSPQHVRGHDLRVRGVGAADADADAMEVGRAELAAQRLQAVVAGQAAAEAGADVAEREVDLVVDHDHAIEVELERAARRTDGAPGLVHVGLRLQHRDARAARAGAALGQLTGELLLRLGQVPAPDQPLGDLEADVVRALGVARPRVSQPDDQPVDGCGALESQDSSPESAFWSASSAVSPSACAAAASESIASPSSPTSAVSVSISSSTGSSVGGAIVASTVSSGSSSSVTPSGGVSADSVTVSF